MTISQANHTLAIDRRTLLQGLGAGALVISFSLHGARDARAQATAAARKTLDAKRVDAYFAIHSDGSVTLYCGKVDLGTGLRAAMPQIVADELGAPIERIRLIEGDTSLTPDQGPTSGSNGIQRGGVQIRQAAATARAALIALGAQTLGLPAAALDAWDGVVAPKAGGPGVPFPVLIGDRRIDLPLDPKAPRRPHTAYRYVGKDIRRPDIPAKITGAHVWMHDFAVDGMLHGRAIRPPRPGAKLVSVDEGSIAAIEGARVVRIKDFVGVVAPREWRAVQAAKALKLTWDGGGLPTTSAEVIDYITTQNKIGEKIVDKRGDFPGAWPGVAKKVAARFSWPAQSHASLGPSCAVADVRADGATIWTASQGTHRYAKAFARFLGLPADRVRLIYLDGAGCYGMNGHEDAAADAALLSRAVGRPVRVQWSREDELLWDPKGPPQAIAIEAGLDDAGRIAAWRSHIWIPRPTRDLPVIPMLAPEAAGLDQVGGIATGSLNSGVDPIYTIAHVETVQHELGATPLRPSHLRAPGKAANLMAVETVMDELALLAGQDPLAFRIAHLQDPRALDALRALRDLHGWEARVQPRRDGVGRGVAFTQYKNIESFVAMAMDVAVDPSTGLIRVKHVSCVHDCGQIISPDGVRSQVEGCILQTISRTLLEETTFDHTRVLNGDWDSYPILRFPDVPTLAIKLIDRPEMPPMGAGEAAVAVVAAAIANAAFDATGVRLRQAPFTPNRVRAAMADGASKAG